MFSKYDNTISTSHVDEYLGNDGLSSYTPLMNLLTSSCCPKLIQSSISIYPDKADLAEQIALQLSPAENNVAKKFIASSTVGQ